MNAIKRLRLKRGVSLTEMAALLGVTKPYVVQLGNGGRTISMERATEIAEELGVVVEDVFEPVRFRARL